MLFICKKMAAIKPTELNALINSPLFDAGLNAFSAQFDADRLDMLQRSRDAGVAYQLCIASDLAEAELNLQLCAQFPDLLTTAGVHPHQAARVEPGWLEQLTHLVQRPDVCAVGECGLDFNRMFSPQELQIDVFQQQLQLATTVNKAVYLHERDAFDTQISLLKAHQIHHGIAHCFTSSQRELAAYVDLGLYIGITGWVCDERRGAALQDAVRYLPLDRLILETDAPYLLPRNLATKPKSRRNEPAFLMAIAEMVAHLKQCPVEQVLNAAWHNSCQLFNVEAPDVATLA